MSDGWKKLEGQKDELVGKVKEVWGKATDNAELQAKGISQQVEGEVKQAAATGRAVEADLIENAKERAVEADEQIKRQIKETQDSVNQSADEALKAAIDEGKRIKEDAAREAENIRKAAVEKGEQMREEAREQYVHATEVIGGVEDRAKEAIDEVLHPEHHEDTNEVEDSSQGNKA